MSRWMKKASAWLLALVIMAAYMPAQQVQAEGTGWVERDGCTYYLDEEGRRVYGWYRVDGIPYYFNENGALASIWGIDVSEFQGTIDWNKVKNAGCQFAILRLGFRSYGASGYMYEDECFDAYIRGAQAVGIPVGIYFYSQAITPEEAVAEAEYVLQTLSKYPAVEFPIAIDIEDTAVSGRVTKANLTQRQYTDIVLAFCDRIQQAGYDAMVYSYYSILEHRIYDEEMAPNNIDIWYADYHAYPNTYGGDFTVWQYSATEGISGISGNVDKNVATVDYAGRYQDLATRGSLEPLPGEVVDGNATSRPEMEMLN